MPEAEEVLMDAARHATVAAQQVWQRWRKDRAGPNAPQRWLLADCRSRLELLVEAVLGMRLPVRVAQPAAPVSWLGRMLRHGNATPAASLALPANDGSAIYLPPDLGIVRDANGEENRNDYPLLALLQGLRVMRGSVHSHADCDSPLAADLYLLAEAAASECSLRELVPGWCASLDALYARTAGSLIRPQNRNPIRAEVIELYGALLERRDRHLIPLASTPQAALGWALERARLLDARHPHQRYQRCLADMVIGRLLPPEAAPVRLTQAGAQNMPQAQSRRVALSRRPRVRESEEGEDDDAPGVWMIQTSDPHEHAEDPFGLSRPQDHDPDSDAQGVADSLSELESARLVSTPGRAAETLVSNDAPPRLEHETTFTGSEAAFAYPEWDCRIAAYHACAVHVHVAPAAYGSPAWAVAALQRHAATLHDVRRRLNTIRPYRQILKRQTEGDDIDCDAVVDERSERRAGATPAGALYQQHRPSPRRIGLLLLIDASASTDAWVADAQRVIDIEKDAALVAACALDMVLADFAVLTFSGEGPHGVQMRTIKDFGDSWNADAMRRLAAVEPDRYTRLGGAVRHASAMLARRTADSRLLLLFSDGKPNDCDRYSSTYGLEDARQALIEARVQHIDPYCFTVDREAGSYLPHLFGTGHYTIVQRAQQLPLAFVDWLRGVVRRASR
ncbi:MAG TPA: hypothetical protein VJ654_20945 [Noviherbaspirillum sp.]|nr:hypothetical protein [Noviherbaspirillum sp.]